MNHIKSRRVLIMGYPYFVNRMKELAAGSDYQVLTATPTILGIWLTMLRCDLIYLIGGDLRPNRFYKAALFLRKKLIMHWVGSDILEMKDWHKKGRFFCPFLLKKAVHWAEVDWTARELKELGVKAQVIPLTPAAIPDEIKEMPPKFVALVYLPPGKEPFYGGAEIVQLARELPEITFLAVAASPTVPHPDWPANIIPVGWVDDMEELYGEVTVLIRLTEHDGLSFMVLEALANGRYVVWSYPFDGVYHVKDYSQLTGTMTRLYQDFIDGKLPVNQSGRSWIEQHFQPQAIWQQIHQGIERVLR